ncbi:M57 family metalloprotease [Aquimarina sp. RZ0]|uniref:M57 family metalloprotease n=1 Tax=Aquimarina sp. RZ0 TaxID=2607730 RepID=UPI00210577B3|nr:M57 family metalloprotease [Aquimarina sp. RZ0]
MESQDLKQMTKDFSHQSSETTTKLYVRTNTNRISLPANGKRTIVVAGLSNTERKLDNTQMQALEDAVNDLNSLNLEAVSLKFEKRTEKQHEESNNKNSTVLILRDARNINDFREGEFAIASFSKNGNPGSPITITPNNTELNTPEFFFKGIFLHELGHTFGIVHSDFDTRTSCGLNTTDGSRNRVIEHIPGTSTDTSDTNSIMAACATDIGVFSLTSQDKTAIRRIFQRAEF